MKVLFFTAVMVAALGAQALPQCNAMTATQVSTNTASSKVYDFSGDFAKQAWESISSEAVAADPASFAGRTVFNAKVKSFGAMICWNYVPSFIQVVETGKPADCQIYTCSITLAK